MNRILMRYIKDDKSLLQKLYYSPKLDWLFNLINLPNRIYLYVAKFIYYGKVGANCYDFEATSCYELVYAHIKRCRKFMDSDKTHLVWNSQNKPKGLIRKLYELEELLRRYLIDELDSKAHTILVYDSLMTKYDVKKSIWSLPLSKEDNKLLDIARKSDRMVYKSRKNRLDELMSKYLESFWD